MNLSLLLDMAVDGFGDRPVVGPRDAGLTPRRIRQLAVGGAQVLRTAGADALVYFGVNGPTVNYRLGADQLAGVLRRHRSALGVAGPAEVDALRAAGINSRLMTEWWTEIEARAADEGPGTETGAPAALIYTSGTTSVPKGVVIRPENLVSYVFGTVEFASAAEDDAALISVPPYHIAAVANAISNLYAGRRTIVLEQFQAREWLDLVRDQGVTNALVVPTMLARLMAADDADPGVPTLRTLAYGGAPMPAHVIGRALRLWPNVDFQFHDRGARA